MSEHPKQLVLVPNAADFVNTPGGELTNEQVTKVRRSSEAVLDIVFGLDADTAEKDQAALTIATGAATAHYIAASGLNPEDPLSELIAMMRLGTLLLNRAIGTGTKSKVEALLMQANIGYLMVEKALEENEGAVADAFHAHIEAATPDFERTRLRIKVVGEGNCPCDAHLAQAGHDPAVQTLADLPADIRQGLEFIAQVSGQDVQAVFDQIQGKLQAGGDPTVAAEDLVESTIKRMEAKGDVGVIEGDTAPETQAELDAIIAEIVKGLPADKRALATQRLREKLTLADIRSGKPITLEIDLT